MNPSNPNEMGMTEDDQYMHESNRSMAAETIEQLPSDYVFTEMFKAIDIEQIGKI